MKNLTFGIRTKCMRNPNYHEQTFIRRIAIETATKAPNVMIWKPIYLRSLDQRDVVSKRGFAAIALQMRSRFPAIATRFAR